LKAYQSSNHLFLQVEKEADPNSLVCAFHSVDLAAVLANLPHLSMYIRQCIKEEEPIPFEIQEHTTLALSKLVKKTPNCL
jgi:hypothetical protein